MLCYVKFSFFLDCVFGSFFAYCLEIATLQMPLESGNFHLFVENELSLISWKLLKILISIFCIIQEGISCWLDRFTLNKMCLIFNFVFCKLA